MNRLPALTLMSLILSLSAMSCVKEEYPITVPIEFLIPAKITPSSRTIQRGDTLWLEASFSDSLFDKTTGRRYRVRPEDFKLDSYIVYRELLGVGQLPVGIAPTFRIVEKVGKAWISGSNTGGLQFVYDGRNYKAKIGLIPTKACVTSLIISLLPSQVTSGKPYFLPFIKLAPDASGKERKASYSNGFYVVNEGKANNFDLYSQHNKAWSLDPGVPESTVIYEQQSTFTVEVK